jgi:hypothetical protein
MNGGEASQKGFAAFPLCAEVLDLIDATMQGKRGGDHTSEQSKSNNVSIAHRPVGNNRQQALRKLRKDSPTLHAEVLAGNLSPHAAK